MSEETKRLKEYQKIIVRIKKSLHNDKITNLLSQRFFLLIFKR